MPDRSTSITPLGKVYQSSGVNLRGSNIPWRAAVKNLRDFLRISEAAEYLGVSPNTLRNWENAGKIEAHRHPVNRYRLFKRNDLDAILRKVQEPDKQENHRPRKQGK